MTFDN